MFDIYLDAASTTKPDKRVIKAMEPYVYEYWYNPSSLYSKAEYVKNKIEESRRIVSTFINGKENEIYFTSGGSESNCWAIQGFVQNRICKGLTPHVVTSLIEHKSILDCVKNINADVHYIGVDNNGFINLNQLESVLKYIKLIKNENTEINNILVSIQFANNEIGTIQNIKEVSEIVHRYHAILHTDAVQAFGQIDIDVDLLGIDMLSASGHKIGMLKGSGVLYKKDTIEINPLIYGSQENYMRGGTENVPYIIGFAKAVNILMNCDLYERKESMKEWRNNFILKLQQLGCTVNGSLVDRLPNNINVTLPQNVSGEAIIYMMDMSGIQISSGSACNSHSQSISHVLKSIGLTDDESLRTIRITLPESIEEDERNKVIEIFISEFKKHMSILNIPQ